MKFTLESEPNPYGTEMTIEVRFQESRVSQGTLDRLEELYNEARAHIETAIENYRNR